MSLQQSVPSTEQIYQQFADYPWSTDTDFQSGFHSVLSQLQAAATPDSPTPSEREIEYKAKSFFFERKTGHKVDIEGFKAWESRENNSGGDSEPDEKEKEKETPFPSKYAALVELILSGKPIPGIKEIPDTVLGQEASSSSTAKSRRKPWERNE